MGVESWIPAQCSLFVIRCHLEAEQEALNQPCARVEETRNLYAQHAGVEVRWQIRWMAFSDALQGVLANSEVKIKKHSQRSHNDL